MCDEIKALQAALARLEGSKGRRVARRNARRSFLKVITECKRLLTNYPPLAKDGTEITINRPRGVRCPGCNVPMASVRVFCNHWAKEHGDRDIYDRLIVKCKCGKAFGAYSSLSLRAFRRHVAGLKDIQVHFMLGALAGIGGGK